VIEIMQNKTVIDDAFIDRWEAEYDKIEGDDKKYDKIIEQVKEDISRIGTISKDTLEEIYNWKAARAKGYVKWEDYSKYEEAIGNSLRAPEDKKKAILDDLPGIGIPVASTILHFVYPETFSIVDIRTVEFLQNAGYLDKLKSYYYFRDTIQGYSFFCHVIKEISQRLPKKRLRQIDKAMFENHKKQKKQKSCHARYSHLAQRRSYFFSSSSMTSSLVFINSPQIFALHKPVFTLCFQLC